MSAGGGEPGRGQQLANAPLMGYNGGVFRGGHMALWISRTCLLLMVVARGAALPAQETVRASVPERIVQSLDGLQKTRTANGVFQITYQKAYFWALEKSVYVNVAFTADLDRDVAGMKDQIKKQYDERVAAEMKKLEAINKKIKKDEEKKTWQPPALEYPASFHNLYMRVVQGGQVLQEYRSRIPFDGQATAYYSFGTILVPGDYEVLVDITRLDNTLDGTQIFPLQVPALRLGDITVPSQQLSASEPVFYAEVKQLLQPETQFTVLKNRYQNGPAALDFVPWGDRPFRSQDSPTLAFFILGAAMAQGAEPWSIEAVLEIRRGKETAATFESLKLTNPYFYQPIQFVKKDKGAAVPLPAGEYVLAIALKDNNQGGKAKGSIEIPLRIVE
jgi:hypothetical protein